ncbi:hypothetical protein LA635_3228 [Erwinia amylovora LA635]|nr:hypothetical protein EAM01S_01_01860 [Erwinia amylovora NBRC 12687 = CFBP 1232]CDK16852.1 hypothetical protein LA635_3228 [Erwinia amylovora LA635]CDK20220.1 hypothetical protein LA636_3228 [Erwinia amylovora LA636]CDK23591.1 hypothetical protein LA637_3231 [Erwinia amylovora LA637]
MVLLDALPIVEPNNKMTYRQPSVLNRLTLLLQRLRGSQIYDVVHRDIRQEWIRQVDSIYHTSHVGLILYI